MTKSELLEAIEEKRSEYDDAAREAAYWDREADELSSELELLEEQLTDGDYEEDEDEDDE